MKKDARSAALHALLRVEVEEGYSNLVIDKTLRSFGLENRDASLATTIFYGVLERRITLDYILSQFSKIPLNKLEPTVLEILRIGLYQIFYLEKIPDSAAVNEAVNLTKEEHHARSSGFVNGILRSILRQKENIHYPDSRKAKRKYDSVKYSCPEWLIQLWENAYGTEKMHALLESLSAHAPVYIRVNETRITTQDLIKKLSEENVLSEEVDWLPGALELKSTGSIPMLNAYQEGLFHVQDLSSQLCCQLLAPSANSCVIDVCAAPGGKSFTIAELMKNSGAVYSFDKYKGKVGLIRQGAERLGLSIVQAHLRDATKISDQLQPADFVLCDAPCSGLGIIRRKPEIRYKKKAEVEALPELQYQILCSSASLVKTGGILFYSTCTLNPKENGEIAERFLKEHDSFERFLLPLPSVISRKIEEPVNQFTLFPNDYGTDGFFISGFRRIS